MLNMHEPEVGRGCKVKLTVSAEKGVVESCGKLQYHQSNESKRVRKDRLTAIFEEREEGGGL